MKNRIKIILREKSIKIATSSCAIVRCTWRFHNLSRIHLQPGQVNSVCQSMIRWKWLVSLAMKVLPERLCKVCHQWLVGFDSSIGSRNWSVYLMLRALLRPSRGSDSPTISVKSTNRQLRYGTYWLTWTKPTTGRKHFTRSKAPTARLPTLVIPTETLTRG